MDLKQQVAFLHLQKLFGPKKFCLQKSLSQKILVTKNFGLKKFCPKKYFGPKKYCFPNNNGPKKISWNSGPKIIWVKKSLSKKYWWQKDNGLTKNVNKMLVIKVWWSKRVSQKRICPKKILSQKLVRKFGPKHLFC